MKSVWSMVELAETIGPDGMIWRMHKRGVRNLIEFMGSADTQISRRIINTNNGYRLANTACDDSEYTIRWRSPNALISGYVGQKRASSAQLRGLLLSDPFTPFAKAANGAPGSGRSAMIGYR